MGGPKRKARSLTPEPPREEEAAAIVIREPKTLSEMKQQSLTLRRLGKVLYVRDPDERSIEWHWENDRDDRGKFIFKGNVPLGTFLSWSTKDGWAPAREAFWNAVEMNVLLTLQDDFTRQKIEELRVMTESRAYLTEYLFPIKRNGEVERYPDDHSRYPGLPRFPLDLGNMPKFIEAFLKLDERMMLKRGEAINRTQTEVDDRRAAADPETSLGPAAALAKQVNLSPDDLRAMATMLIKKANTEHGESEEDVIDVGGDGEESVDGEDL